MMFRDSSSILASCAVPFSKIFSLSVDHILTCCGDRFSKINFNVSKFAKILEVDISTLGPAKSEVPAGSVLS